MAEITKAQETKIALLIEGFEGLVGAIVLDNSVENLADARAELHDRLREFLLPALRIIDGAAQTTHQDTTVTCRKCGANRQCLDYGIGACPDWAASIKIHIGAEPDTGGEVA
jgi:hypothetical protein